VRGLVRVHLGDAVHRERARALQPHRVAGALPQAQERIAVAAGAMAQVRSLGQRPGMPGGFARLDQQRIERRARRHSGQVDHEAGGAVAVLHQHPWRLARRRV
jgi:hypothetical protein